MTGDTQEVIGLLRCPVTGGALRLEGGELVSEIGGLRFPIREGIPVLLPEAAKLPPGIPSLAEFRARYLRSR